MHVDAALTLRSENVTAEAMAAALGVEADDAWEPGDSLARRRSPRMRRGDHGLALRVSGNDAGAALGSLGARLGEGTEAAQRLVAGGEAEATVVLFVCGTPTDDPTAAVEAGIDRLADALGTDLAPSGERGGAKGSAHLSTWTSATTDPAAPTPPLRGSP